MEFVIWNWVLNEELELDFKLKEEKDIVRGDIGCKGIELEI